MPTPAKVRHRRLAKIKECRRYLAGLLDNSRIRQLADCQLADWMTRGLDISRTGQLADATGDFVCLVFVLLAASGDRELSSPRLVQSAS